MLAGEFAARIRGTCVILRPPRNMRCPEKIGRRAGTGEQQQLALYAYNLSTSSREISGLDGEISHAGFSAAGFRVARDTGVSLNSSRSRPGAVSYAHCRIRNSCGAPGAFYAFATVTSRHISSTLALSANRCSMANDRQVLNERAWPSAARTRAVAGRFRSRPCSSISRAFDK
jgi:hypothetical protein